MPAYLRKEKWSPYLAGCLIAVLAIFSLFLFHKTIGISVTFVKMAAFLWSIVDPKHLQENLYYQDYLQNKAWIDWQSMLVLGLFLGAFISRKLNAEASLKPVKWHLTGGASTKRYAVAFLGGVIVMLGARFAGGCTSGHAITGGFQLALSGWLFMIGVFALGIPTAFIIYPKKT
jgi:uncharacterized membrane protein YedE/YeeE